MSEERLRELLASGPLLMDGATGHLLFQRGMPAGVCPEAWVLDNPDVIEKMVGEYVAAGSRVVLTPTFGANRIKLGAYGLEHRVGELNRRLAQTARSAAGEALVAGDLSMTGEFVRPIGSLSFEDAVEIYREQIRGLMDGGVDLLFVETMVDLGELRAALIAAREISDLPVICSMTFEESGRTLTGVHPASAVITLQSLGAFAVGCNCSSGPRDMLGVISEMAPYARVPLVAKPNAGVPRVSSGGRAEYSLSPEEFARGCRELLSAGVEILGGCCGTDPVHIRTLARVLDSQRGTEQAAPPRRGGSAAGIVCSSRARVRLDDYRLGLIGERINPSRNRRLSESLAAGEMGVVREYALQQEAAGADLLDINVGSLSAEEGQVIDSVIEVVATRDIPVAVDSADPKVIRRAVRAYPGRALINSISAESDTVDDLLSICRDYGSAFIALPIDDEGIPDSVSARFDILRRLRDRAVGEYGIDPRDILYDCLMLPLSTDEAAAQKTLDLIGRVTEELDGSTVIGLSNLSFGLPARSGLNATFLAMAALRGLRFAIADPCDDAIAETRKAADALLGRDKGLVNYLGNLGCGGPENPPALRDVLARIRFAVLNGLYEGIDGLVAEAAEDHDAEEILDSCLFEAIREVGSRYEQGHLYLPHLIASAQAVENAVAAVETLYPGRESLEGPVVVLATVRGDIHDIGKNLVGMMLRNHGFRVVDLGKDVDSEEILIAVLRERADLVGLSALMTTTAVQMRDTVALIRRRVPACRIMVGGAVITGEFARTIGAHGYAPDAYAAVTLAADLLGAGAKRNEGE